MPEGRYDRQLGLPELQDGGQDKLAAARVTVVGAGGLGSSLLISLVGTGVRKLRIIDNDIVSMSNLNRQFLYTPADIGFGKAEQAAKRLVEYEPELEFEVVSSTLADANGIELLQASDLVISCVDSSNVRYMINAACCKLGITYVDAAVNAFYGYVSYIVPGSSACYVCQNGTQPEQKMAEAIIKKKASQVIGSIPVVIGAMQAQLAIAVILGCSQTVPGFRYYYNGKDQSVEWIEHQRDPECPVCGDQVLCKDGDMVK